MLISLAPFRQAGHRINTLNAHIDEVWIDIWGVIPVGHLEDRAVPFTLPPDANGNSGPTA